jgi:hypothetical protein
MSIGAPALISVRGGRLMPGRLRSGVRLAAVRGPDPGLDRSDG